MVMAVLLLQATINGFPSGADRPVQLPCALSGTPLRVLSIESYDGPFLEDGSCQPVAGVAAVVLENTGSVTLRCGAVRLLQGRQVLVFSFTMLPPGAKMLVAEKSRKSLSGQTITGCWGWSLESNKSRQISLSTNGRAGFLVTNLTDSTLDALVRFKAYDTEQSLYIGGYSFQAVVEDLKPGIPRVVPVYCYATGHIRPVG